tara:strand:- start:8703 stop:8840 length:138 start_codon:yes stop_codon:yes gene_type:complete
MGAFTGIYKSKTIGYTEHYAIAIYYSFKAKKNKKSDEKHDDSTPI